MRIFISAPYTIGDQAVNINRAIKVADELLALGFAVYVPHLTHLWHLISPKPYDVWLKLDLEFLDCCDYVLRLDGKSDGADREVEEAKRLCIPVFYGLEDLICSMNI